MASSGSSLQARSVAERRGPDWCAGLSKEHGVLAEGMCGPGGDGWWLSDYRDGR